MVTTNAERQTFYSLMPSLLPIVCGWYTKLTVSPSLVKYPELYLSNSAFSNFHLACLHQSILFYLCLVVANSIHLSKINESVYYRKYTNRRLDSNLLKYYEKGYPWQNYRAWKFALNFSHFSEVTLTGAPFKLEAW